MKQLFIAAVSLLLVACHAKNELSKDEAKQLIEKDLKERGPASIDISTVDEEFIAGLRDTKLVKDGYIKFIPKPGAYQPRIEFSPSTERYAIEVTSEKTDAPHFNFRFKLADMQLKAIHKILLTEDGSQAAAQYTYTWVNPSPFFELQQNKSDQTTIGYFKLQENGWVLTDSPSPEQKSLSF